MENNKIVELTKDELNVVNGGIVDPVTLGLLTLGLTYFLWAADFCYTLGKD